MLCDLLSSKGVMGVRKGKCLLLSNNRKVPPVQNNMTCRLMFLPTQQKQNNTKASGVHTTYYIIKLLFEN